MFGWYSIVPNHFWGWKKKTFSTFLWAGPFTLENHICVKALKCKVFQIIRCLIKPLLKTASRQFFKVIPHEWLSYSTIWMFGWYSIVPNNFWVWKKNKTLESKLKSIGNKLKVNWNQLKVNWSKFKSIKSKLKSIESKLKSIKSKLKSIKNKLKSIENQLISIENNLISIESN